jgi:hypothetical protein
MKTTSKLFRWLAPIFFFWGQLAFGQANFTPIPIIVGASPNNEDGDQARAAYQKVNSNLVAVATAFLNVGSPTSGVTQIAGDARWLNQTNPAAGVQPGTLASNGFSPQAILFIESIAAAYGGSGSTNATYLNGLPASAYLQNTSSVPVSLSNQANNLHGSFNGQKFFDVTAYGAIPDGRYIQANITNGSASVSVVHGTVSTNDVGSYVHVTFGGNTNQDLLTTIATVPNSSSFTMAIPAGNSNTNTPIFVAKTDNAPAFQAAVNACLNAGGGTVYFPGGQYLQLSTVNVSEIQNGGLYGQKINFLGPVEPGIGLFSLGVPPDFSSFAGVALLVFGPATGNGWSMFQSTNAALYFNSVGCDFKDLQFRYPVNPNCTVLNMSACPVLRCANIVIDSGFSEYDPRIPQPTYTNSYAILAPATGNFEGGQGGADHCLIWGGIYNGIALADHFDLYSVSVDNCYNGILPVIDAGSVAVGLDLEGCYNPIQEQQQVGGSGDHMVISGLWVENSGGIYSNWWTSARIVNDPNNHLTADITRWYYDGFTNVGASGVTMHYLSEMHPGVNISPATNYFSGALYQTAPAFFGPSSSPVSLGYLYAASAGVAANNSTLWLLPPPTVGNGYVFLMDDQGHNAAGVNAAKNFEVYQGEFQDTAGVYPVSTNVMALKSTGIVTNVTGTAVTAQFPVTVNGKQFYIDLKQ